MRDAPREPYPASPQLTLVLLEQDRALLRELLAYKPDGPRDAERTEHVIEQLRRGIELRERLLRNHEQLECHRCG